MSDRELTESERLLAKRIILEADCKALLDCLNLCDKRMVQTIIKSPKHQIAERMIHILPRMEECDKEKILGVLSVFLNNFETMSNEIGKHPIRIFSASILSFFNEKDFMDMNTDGLDDLKLNQFGTRTQMMDSFSSRKKASKEAIDSWINPVANNAPVVTPSKEWIDKATVFSVKCSEEKRQERKTDNDSLEKRNFNGKIGEIGVYKYYGKSLDKYIDLKIGHSRDFDSPDLKDFPVKAGVKNVEKEDATFWTPYPSIELFGETWRKNISDSNFKEVVKRSPENSGEFQVLTRSYSSGINTGSVEIVAVVTPKDLSKLCDWTFYFIVSKKMRLTKALQGTKCAYTGWSLFTGAGSKYRKPTGNIEIDFSKS